MLPLLIGGAALGALKYNQDQKNSAKDRQVAAATARYSPWTGMKPQDVKRPDAIGDVMQGGLAGAGLGQNMDSADNAQALNDSVINKNNAEASAYGPQTGDSTPAPAGNEQAMNMAPGSAWTGMNGSAGAYGKTGMGKNYFGPTA
jgi:hypothetical protein